MRFTSIPSLDESSKLEKTVINSVVIKRDRNLFTSATFPRSPIMFLKSSSFSAKH